MLVGWALRDFLRKSLRFSQEDYTRRMLLHGAVAGILAILVGGMLERNLGDSEVLTLFWAMLACGYTAIQQETEPHEPTSH
jgi:predicted MFS family arabinose efflux permease